MSTNARMTESFPVRRPRVEREASHLRLASRTADAVPVVDDPLAGCLGAFAALAREVRSDGMMEQLADLRKRIAGDLRRLEALGERRQASVRYAR